MQRAMPPQNPLPSEMNDPNQFHYHILGSGGRNNQFCGRNTRGGKKFVQCQIRYKFGPDASYCYYLYTQDPFGISQTFGNFSAHQSDVWTQPGYKSFTSMPLQPSRPISPSPHSQYTLQRPQYFLSFMLTLAFSNAMLPLEYY